MKATGVKEMCKKTSRQNERLDKERKKVNKRRKRENE